MGARKKEMADRLKEESRARDRNRSMGEMK
jgi:hypothetical protein